MSLTLGPTRETDLGNETQSVLAAKVALYERLRLVGGPAWPVLFWLPMAAMGPLGVLIATANRRDAEAVSPTDPAGPVWTVVGGSDPTEQRPDAT